MSLYNLLDSFEKTLYIHTLYAKIFGSTVVYVTNYSKTIKKKNALQFWIKKEKQIQEYLLYKHHITMFYLYI